MPNPNPQILAAAGKRAFEKGDFAAARQAFSEAAETYLAKGDSLNAAEMKNNLSVALLKAKRAQEALEAVAGTEDIFAQAGDVRRQALAIGNQAAALEALGRLDEAIAAYERCAALLAEVGEGDLQSSVLQSAAALKLRRGKFTDSAIALLGSLESVRKPSLLQRLMKFLLRLKP